MKEFFEKLHQETSTKENDIEGILKFYKALAEENQDLYKETKHLIDEIDKLKDQKLSMQIELKEVLKNKDKK